MLMCTNSPQCIQTVKSADIGGCRGVVSSVQSLLRRDSSVVRALVRITRGPGLDPKLRCLHFFASPSECQCFLSKGTKRMV